MKQKSGNGKRRTSLSNLKTAVTTRLHTKPPAEGQLYLELYTLKRDHGRWTQAKEHAEQMLESIDKAMKKINLPEDDVSSDEADEPRAKSTIDFNIPQT